jgi:methyl-accepting chemotaxis protein
MSWINNVRVSVKVSAVFAAICLVVGVSTAAIYTSLSTMKTTEHWTVHTYEVLEQLSDVVGGMVNAETGVRGYLIAGEPAFLGPYESGQKQFQAAADKVGSLTSDNAGQQKRLERVRAHASDWLTNVAQREIALMKDPATQSKARELEASGAGKKAMDALRALVQEMDAEERALLTVRAAASEAASTNAVRAMMIGGGVTLLLSLLGALGVATMAKWASSPRATRRWQSPRPNARTRSARWPRQSRSSRPMRSRSIGSRANRSRPNGAMPRSARRT